MARIKTRTATDGTFRYTAEVRLKGYPAQTATFKRKTDANKWIQDTESAIREGRHFKTVEAKKHTFADLVDRYIKDVLPTKPKQAVRQKMQLEWWSEKMGVYLLSDVTPALIVQYRNELSTGMTYRGTQRSPATVVRYMAALSHAFSIAVNEWEWLEDSPTRKVKNPTESDGRVRFLDDDERAKLLAACKESSNPLLYPCVILALSTGMRQGELMGLKWPDVNLKDNYLILHKTKNGTRRRVPLAGHGLELLREHAKVRRLDTQLLFPGKVHADKPMLLRGAFTEALKAAEITDFHWHDLRHCTASYLAMNGASLAEIAEILGHKTLQMVKRYAHLSDGHVSSVIESMNAKIFGGV
ncbi:MAG: site-specific integrase [Methylobacter sp.]|uniref:tyrosine-type recombinase/integrase n=1 Tax=Methylobacter sp. TaxID=2051955 RepID=UPI00272F59E3|nr:site-specific integrase [Methylobacter sp.]MDP1667084.1 site-specific integrase [Methylobacter sp.]